MPKYSYDTRKRITLCIIHWEHLRRLGIEYRDSGKHIEMLACHALRDLSNNENDNTGSQGCALCEKFRLKLECLGCPIANKDYRCPSWPSRYQKVANARTWDDFINQAGVFINFLKGLR